MQVGGPVVKGGGRSWRRLLPAAAAAVLPVAGALAVRRTAVYGDGKGDEWSEVVGRPPSSVVLHGDISSSEVTWAAMMREVGGRAVSARAPGRLPGMVGASGG